DYPCGGRGLCNQCTVVIQPPTESGRGGRKPLAAEAVAKGLRLACQAVIEGDCTVTIPEEKEVEIAWKDPAAVESAALVYGEKVIRRRRLRLPPPSLEDQNADWERLGVALAGARLPAVKPPLVEGFARALREGKWEVDALLE